MKKEVKILLFLIISLSIVSAICIFTLGRTYNAVFSIIRDNNTKLDISGSGEVTIIDELYSENEYILKVKAKKPGKVYISYGLDDMSQSKVLYIHKSMIISDNQYFGYSTGSEVIPISISIILLYVLYLLVKKYRKSIKKSIYQYRNVAYLGIIIFLSSLIVNNVLSIFNYRGVYDTIQNVIGSIQALSFFVFPAALLTFILVTISNIRLIIKEGINIRNILGLLLGIVICLLTLLPDYLYRVLSNFKTINIYNLNSIGPYLFNFFEALVYLVVAYLECILIATIVMALKAYKNKLEFNKDYIIILGCQIKKDGTLTPLLKGRVDKAIEFRNKQIESTGKDLVFIPSGGKGDDEIISESQAIKNYLLENGIKEKNILIEDKSKSTYENIKYSNNLIKNKNAKIAFSTTNYHVFRAGLIAMEQGIKMEGMGSSTKAYFWINAFIREFIGTLYSEKKKHILVFSIILVSLIIMISITYFANNM